MRWLSLLSTRTDTAAALEELVRGLKGLPDPTLLIVFLSPHHVESAAVIAEVLSECCGSATLIGCSGGGIIGGGREVEKAPALSVIAACLPDVACRPFLLTDVPNPSDWYERLGVEPEHEPAFLLLPDPFSMDPMALSASLDAAYPRAVTVGGLASGGRGPGEHVLLFEDSVVDEGCVGVALHGDVVVDSLVAQGCRALGEPHRITRGQGSLVAELDGKPAVNVLDELFTDLDILERTLFASSPMVGLSVDADREAYRPGDFLIRHLAGLDRDRGVIAVGGRVETGQVLQFHLRDRHASTVDLSDLLRRQAQRPQAQGALLFSCLGRGEGFYGEHDHDSNLMREHLGDVPLGGFFCNGEIGPVHGRTWLHGYTSSFALFRPRGWS
ncbi:MAG TPA: FIST N-terminal domain-containing protein [Myxococcota bacterium]|nr:FIST N-terminal domain-containing protein [Myxococcota bacterium]